ncbi:MAG: A/G-specific adenine glycosylase [Rhodocyclaceae bacterium]|nr:A/G-specific adenine glycosylase [Rhodocyclaceae bacterium]
MSEFAARLIRWHKRHGRHDLPWQKTTDPYRVWLSEIMLQQTQVATVIPYYERFLARLPTLADLAAVPLEEVMALWSGLGYYARARNLHACARAVMAQHGGQFPRDPAAIAALPGIGRSTANAIADFCFAAGAPILDGNVKRVLCRCFGVEGFPGTPAVERQLWQLAATLLPPQDVGIYIQAQMDLGATLCVRAQPRCAECPLAAQCVARREERVAELPQAKPRRALPEREAVVLVLRHDKRILLEARPPQGIWGGLLSLPELPPGAEVRRHAETLGCRAQEVAELPPLVHTFTHFRLTLRPLLIAAQPLPHAAEAGRRWLAAAEMKAAPLPAPIRKLLKTLSGSL